MSYLNTVTLSLFSGLNEFGVNEFGMNELDNERAIHAESSIFTVSIGRDDTIWFRDIHIWSIEERVVKADSLYSMILGELLTGQAI